MEQIPVAVTAINRDQIAEIMDLYNGGMTGLNVAIRQRIPYSRLMRYIRVYEMYGAQAFRQGSAI